MIIKLLGGVMLFAASSAAGILKAQELCRRVKVIRSLQDGLIIFENEIRYRLSPMRDALLSAASPDLSGVFSSAAENLSKSDAVFSMKEAVGTSTISGEEKEAMLSFAAGLSAEDAEGQIKNAALCRERLKSALKDAENRRARLYKLYLVSGGVSGAALFIIII